MFDADRPILSHEQDRLGRAVFAKYLARCMLDHNNPESLVIGLQGGWGSGKTSLINLILEELHIASNNMFDDEKPIILNFSPWSYSGQGQLIYGFFRRLSSELRRFPYLDKSDQIIRLLELYVSFFTQQAMPKSLRLKHSIMNKLRKPLRGKQEAIAWDSGRDPTLVKAELNELLKKQKHKIIIMIDNISRLEPAEVNQILQIVKSMGDYVNTIYLLSYDKSQVVSAINQLHPGEGKAYLDKLVQLPFEVPEISKQDLENLLLDRLQQVVHLMPEGSWDHTYWADIFYSSLKYFFNSCRDITRYVNTLSFSFPRVKDVTNPVDFLALTAIEVFEPQVYLGIRDNKDLFTDLLDNVYTLDQEESKKDRLRCDEILQRTKNIPRELLLKLVLHLFPRLRNVYEPGLPHYHSEALARQNRRVCSPDMFDIYFRLSIPTGYITESETNTILALSSNEALFAQALLRLNQDDRIVQFLNFLDGTAFHKIAKKNVGNVVSALINCADLFPEGTVSPLSFNTDQRVHRICHQLLRHFSSTEERFTILHDAIKNADKSIHIIVNELDWQEQEHIETEASFLPLEHRHLTSEQLRQLQTLTVTKIAFWARIGRLAEHPKLLPILYAWKRWSHQDDCQQFIKQMSRDDKSLLAFLCAALKDPIEQAMTKLKKNDAWKNSLENITFFVPTEMLEPRVIAIFEDESFDKLKEKEQLAVLIFLDLTNAKTVKITPKTTV